MKSSNKKSKSKKSGMDPHYFDVIKCPHVTEKSHSISEYGQVIFKVLRTSTKDEIKLAIEALFDIKIKDVNVINMKGKEKIFRGRRGKRSDWKKAIVTLKDKDQLQKIAMEAES